MRLPLLPPRPLVGPLKPIESARTALTRLPDRRLRMTIEHEVVHGCPPAMLNWWFHNIGGTMPYLGGVESRYLVWHPLDHIHWELARPAAGGGVGVGARFRIVESFGREHYINSVETVEKLDDTGIRLVQRAAGIQFFSLEHFWFPEGDGTRYRSEMNVGFAGPIGRLANPLINKLVFGEAAGYAWLRHNVEEVGYFERFLPDLHRASQE